VGLVNYLWPSLTILLSVPLLGVPGRWLLVPGVLLAGAGAAMVLGATGAVTVAGLTARAQAHPAPYALALAAAVSWALYSVLSRRLAGSAPGNAVPLFMLATGAVLGGAQWAFPEAHQWSVRVAAEAAYVAVVSTLGYAFWDLAMRRGDLVLVATVSYFAPLLSTLIGAAYLGVRPAARLWVGGALLVAAALVCRRATRPRPLVGRDRPLNPSAFGR
jgi:drug/metabolite transporter (DMT)-like permease